MIRIAQATAQVLRAPEYPNGGSVLVRVRTESGVGECFVAEAEGRVVVGQDVRHTEAIWERMHAVCGGMYDRRCLAIHAPSGVDMAAHDAAARALGVPLCVLLGGPHRDGAPRPTQSAAGPSGR